MKIRVHMKKIHPGHFDRVLCNQKKAEARKDDCDYQVGDLLALNEWTGSKGFSGRVVYRFISHILRGGQCGIDRGYAVLSLDDVPQVIIDMFHNGDARVTFVDAEPSHSLHSVK